MTAEPVGPDPVEDERTVTVPLRYGLCAVYTLREKPKPPPPRPDGAVDEPPPWEVALPEGLTPWEQAELEYRTQQR